MSIQLIDSLQQQLGLHLPSVEEPLYTPSIADARMQVWIKRDDQIHGIISGNKWRKLKYALIEALANKVQHIVSFGGGHSNHLHALGYACKQLELEFTAIVRGNYQDQLTPCLQDLTRWQTHLQYISKLDYKKRTEPDYIGELQKSHPDALIIPEGGSQRQAMRGIGEIIAELTQAYDYIVAPVASGGTLAGLIQAAPTNTKIIGIGVLKGEGYLEDLVQRLLPSHKPNWQILHDFHWGGYAKRPQALQDYCADFAESHKVPIEPIYSGKLMFAFEQLLAQSYFPSGSKVLLLHTGGLQGARA